MKHGKLPARHDPRTLRLADYLSDLPSPIHFVDNARRVNYWPMYSNDTISDCTCAAAGHLIQVWTANANREVTPTDTEIVDAYEAISGYRPGDPGTDKGTTKLAVLNYWRKRGIAARKIWVYAAIEPGNDGHLKDAVQLFGGAYIGLKLPLTAKYQLRKPLSKTIWSVPPAGAVGEAAPGTWEGHSVPVVGYDQRVLTVVSWGSLMKMTWQFFKAYCDEGYAILTHEWIEAKGRPHGFDFERLMFDLAYVAD